MSNVIKLEDREIEDIRIFIERFGKISRSPSNEMSAELAVAGQARRVCIIAVQVARTSSTGVIHTEYKMRLARGAGALSDCSEVWLFLWSFDRENIEPVLEYFQASWPDAQLTRVIPVVQNFHRRDRISPYGGHLLRPDLLATSLSTSQLVDATTTLTEKEQRALLPPPPLRAPFDLVGQHILKTPPLEAAFPDQPAKDVPALYHYTNAAGFAGIISTGEFWATHVRFMNDAQEVAYGRQLFSEAIDRLAQRSKEKADLLSEANEMMLNEDLFNIFVASFSEDSDDLSQWRGYAGSGGFALGFTPAVLNELAARPGTVLVKVEYDEAAQARSADAMVEQAAEALDDADPFKSPLISVSLSRLLWGARMKHSAFRSEREWRLIYFPGLARSQSFRAAGARLSPYARIPFVTDGLGRLTVTVGPGPTQDLAVRAASQAINNDSGAGWDSLGSRVKVSKIPFRDW